MPTQRRGGGEGKAQLRSGRGATGAHWDVESECRSAAPPSVTIRARHAPASPHPRGLGSVPRRGARQRRLCGPKSATVRLSVQKTHLESVRRAGPPARPSPRRPCASADTPAATEEARQRQPLQWKEQHQSAAGAPSPTATHCRPPSRLAGAPGTLQGRGQRPRSVRREWALARRLLCG